jgi:hypothetical protein
MANSKSTKKGSFADMDNEEIAPQEGPAIIGEAGIQYNIAYKGVSMTESKSKTEAGVVFPAAEFVFEDETGRQHKEKYFKPKTNPEDILYPADKWEKNKADGKWLKVRKLDNEEMIKALNNDVLFFLMDLGAALGYNRDTVKKVLSQAESFEEVIELFRVNYPPIVGKNINMRLLWDNSDNKKTSFLKLRTGGQLIYYPFMKSIFEPHKKGLPSSLKIEEYDKEHRMERKYTQASKAPQATGEGGGEVASTEQKWKPVPGASSTGAAGGGGDEDWI